MSTVADFLSELQKNNIPLDQPFWLYQGKTPREFLAGLGVTPEQTNAYIPDPKAGSLFDDLDWLAPVGAFAGAAMLGGFSGFGGLEAGAGGAFDMAGSAGVFDSFGNPLYNAAGFAGDIAGGGAVGDYGGVSAPTGAFDQGASAGVFDSSGNPLYTSPSNPTMPPATTPDPTGYNVGTFNSSSGGTGYEFSSPDSLMQAAQTAAQAGDTSTLDKIWEFIKTPAGASVAGTLLSSIIGAGGSYFASKAQQNAANDALNLQRYMYDTSRADLAPWRTAGTNALNRIQQLTTPGDTSFTADPGYQWRLSQGEQSINRAMTPRQSFDSGATLKALQNYAQNTASSEYDKVLDRQFRLAGLGQSGTSQGVSLNQNFGNNAANTMMNAGNARASGYMGVANAIGQGVGNLANIYGQYRLMDGI